MAHARVAAALLLVIVSCGGGPVTPTNPWGDPVIGVAGTWHYDATLRDASGGECVGTTLQAAVGVTQPGTITIQQDHATLTAASDFNGVHCTWSGIVDRDSGTLRRVRCDLDDEFILECPSGAARRVALVASTIDITFASEREIDGWQTENYSVYVLGSRQGVGYLTLRSQFIGKK